MCANFWLDSLKERNYLGRSRCRWENIKMDLKEIWLEGVG
jgi:hypothetical protein